MKLLHLRLSSKVLARIALATGFLSAAISGALLYSAWRHHGHTALPLNPQAAYDKNDLDGALSQLATLLKADPTNVRWLVLQSFVLSQKGIETWNEAKYGPQAEAVAQEAVAAAATSSDAYRVLGLAQEVQGNFADAAASYDQALALDPQNGAALAAQGQLAELQGDLAKAQADYTASLSAGGSFVALLGLGRIFALAGHAVPAQNSFANVYKSDPNVYEKAQASYALGMLSLAEGGANVAIAQEEFGEATKLAPFYVSGRLGLGITFYALSVAPATATTSQASYLKSSYELLRTIAEILGSLPQGHAGAPLQLRQDLEMLGDGKLVLAALTAAQNTLAADPSVPDQQKQAARGGFETLVTLIKAQSSVTTKP